MTREFQVLYREMDGAGTAVARPVGQVIALNVQAQSEDVVREEFEAHGFAVVGVNFIRPVVDWSKPFFDLDEAAAFCGMKGGSFSQKKGDGKLPWVHFGRGGVLRHQLEQHLRGLGNEAAKAIDRELAREDARPTKLS